MLSDDFQQASLSETKLCASDPQAIIRDTVAEVFGESLSSHDQSHLAKRISYNLAFIDSCPINALGFLAEPTPLPIRQSFVARLKYLLKCKSPVIRSDYQDKLLLSPSTTDAIDEIALELFNQPYAVTHPTTTPLTFFSPSRHLAPKKKEDQKESLSFEAKKG